MEASMLVNMSAASSATCISAGTLLHSAMELHAATAPPSPIGFEATMSVAMELETKLKAETTDRVSPQKSSLQGQAKNGVNHERHPDKQKNKRPSSAMTSPKGAFLNSKQDDKFSVGHTDRTTSEDISACSPVNSLHRDGSSPIIHNKQLDMLNDSMDGDIMDDDDSNGHSLGSEGPCSYGDISIDTSKDDDMDEDLDPLHKLQNALESNGIHSVRDTGPHPQENNRRSGSREGDYYEGVCNDSSRLHYHRQQQMMHQGDEDIDSQVYQCNICPFTSPSKFHFNSHLNTHYDHKCSLCDYRSRTAGRLKRHMKDFHADLVPEVSPSEKGGKIKGDGSSDNSQVKRKTYRCKQCNYMATVKAEFWAHNKTHIKVEKLLTCPRCPFVTEYKHHLEYHLRNHFGSKPFKCPKCSYSCVNKSMLNSHMKSHSNIYQYRCADCTYATKYCHSLKLHLRKYTHTPATVLNIDGTPNPLPIIDVYGTRRGPRPKKNQNDMYTNEGGPGSNSSVGGSLPFSPLQMPSNGGMSPATAPFFYAGGNSAPHPNGFHTSPNGLLQQSGNMSKPPSHVNNSVKEEVQENARQHATGNSGSFKCNLCEFSTDHNELFSKHMLLHAATENQDLCNLYGITSDTLLQESNQHHHQQPPPQHPQMTVTTMAAVAAAFGFGGQNSTQLHQRGAFYRPSQQSPQQLNLPTTHGNQDKKPNCDHRVSPAMSGTHRVVSRQHVEEDSVRGTAVTLPMTQNPLENLRVFSEQTNMQPFMMRDFSNQLYLSDSHLPRPVLAPTNGGTSDGGNESMVECSNMSNKFTHNLNGPLTMPIPPSQQSNQLIAIAAKNSLPKGPKSPSGRETIGGLGPLDLSNAKPQPPHGHYLSMNQLHHHYQSPFQQFNLQQLQHNQLLTMAALQQHQQQQHELSQQESITHGFSEAPVDESSQQSPTDQGQQPQECLQQQKNRRKGKAFKLDRICMKLHKERGTSSPNDPQVEYIADESGDEICIKVEEVVKGSASRNGHYDSCIRTDNGGREPAQTNSPMHNRHNAGAAALPSVPTKIEHDTFRITPSACAKKSPERTSASKVEEIQPDCASEEADNGSKDDNNSNWKEAYQCQYCDMAFKDCIMYTVHMGYHGFKDPFKCNMCGQQTKDKVAFFLHIARTAHL